MAKGQLPPGSNGTRALPRRSRRSSVTRVLLAIRTEFSYLREVLQGIADYADQHPHWQYYFDPSFGFNDATVAEVDGILAEPAGLFWKKPRRGTAPLIALTGPGVPEGLPAVLSDDVATGHMGAAHLANLGLRHLAFAGFNQEQYSVFRERGFVSFCQARGIAHSVHSAIDRADEGEMSAWLRTLPLPVGILAMQDRHALLVSRACRIAGLRIPEQVALLGIDNETEICRLANPPLSSIDNGARRVGYEGARLLHAWIDHGQEPPPVTMVQPVGVVSRRSTDSLAIDDPEVVMALRFIRAHALDPVKVSDVLAHVAVSRRSLELRFHRALGRTIHAEIMRWRIEHARHLLINSDWSIMQVADACGFGLASQFSAAFRREAGLPPQNFRKEHRYGAVPRTPPQNR
jgi:LacI family transcriptional regulator